MDNRIDHILNQWLLNIGFSETIVHGVQFILELLVLLVLSFVADRLAKKIVVRIISALVKRTTFTWDDVLLENKVFDRLAHLAPALVIQASVRYFLVDFQTSPSKGG